MSLNLHSGTWSGRGVGSTTRGEWGREVMRLVRTLKERAGIRTLSANPNPRPISNKKSPPWLALSLSLFPLHLKIRVLLKDNLKMNYFTGYHSGVVDISTMLQKRHSCLNLEHFYYAKKKPRTLYLLLLTPPFLLYFPDLTGEESAAMRVQMTCTCSHN